MVQELLLGLVSLAVGWAFLYSAVYLGVKHALRDQSGVTPFEEGRKTS